MFAWVISIASAVPADVCLGYKKLPLLLQMFAWVIRIASSVVADVCLGYK